MMGSGSKGGGVQWVGNVPPLFVRNDINILHSGRLFPISYYRLPPPLSRIFGSAPCNSIVKLSLLSTCSDGINVKHCKIAKQLPLQCLISPSMFSIMCRCWLSSIGHLVIQWSSGHLVVIWSSSGHLVIHWSLGHPVVIWWSPGHPVVIWSSGGHPVIQWSFGKSVVLWSTYFCTATAFVLPQLAHTRWGTVLWAGGKYPKV